MKIARVVALAIIALLLVGLLVLAIYPDPLLNGFVRPAITEAFADEYSAYSMRIAGMTYSVWENRFRFSSVAVKAVNGTTAARFGLISVAGADWVQLLWGGTLTPGDFARADAEVKDIRMSDEESGYEFRCERLFVSVPDSEVVVDALKLHPEGDDAAYFARRDFRQTMYRLVVPHGSLNGVDILDALEGTAYRARSVRLNDVVFDVQVNKDKPSNQDAPSPDMPNQMIASIGTLLGVDRVSIMNGRATYIESMTPDLEPARISFDSIRVVAENVSSQGDHGAEMVIRASSLLAKAGTLAVVIGIPLASPELSFHYSGSLSSMDLSSLNSFLEPAEQLRIKTGVLQEATFDVDVTSGTAVGSIRGIYRDLTVASIDKHSGSEKGLADKVTSFLANTFTIHGTNVPDTSETFRIGPVRYTRKEDDTFIQYVWYALRTGVQDVVGF